MQRYIIVGALGAKVLSGIEIELTFAGISIPYIMWGPIAIVGGPFRTIEL